MKNTTLNFYERIRTLDILGVQEARLAEVAIYLRIIDKIRFTEDEEKAAKLKRNESSVQWELPNPEYGTITAQLEDVEAEKLLGLLQSWPHISTRDAKWILRVVDDLKKAA